jgi:predicted phage terminase large subunit-like protein
VQEEQEIIGPSSPKQSLMLNQFADTAILGGAMGSGKSYVSLLYPLKFAEDPHFRGIIFRKTTGEITAQGGLWENACEIYTKIYGNAEELRKQGKKGGIKIHIKDLKITFPAGGSLKFSFLEAKRDLLKHQGAAYTFVLFDEATHFTREMIEYLIKRMRSARAKHKKQMVLTCNPDPDWECLEWIKPYLTEDGTPDQTKDGKIRYYVVDNGEYVWSDSREKLEELYGAGTDSGIRSFTFISANCMDNIPLMTADPTYLSNLKAQPQVDVQRYLYGNWYVRPTGASMVRREWFVEKDQEPAWTEVVKTVRAFDFAFKLRTDSYPNPDYTVSVKMSKLKDGNYFIHDIRRTRVLPGNWMQFILDSAMEDGSKVDIVLPLDPQTRYSNTFISKDLSSRGFYVRQFAAAGKKAERFKPFSSMVMNGGMQILRNCGTDYENDITNDLNFFYKELEAYDGERSSGSRHDDLCDACSDAFGACAASIQIPSYLSGLQSSDSIFKTTNPFA